MLGLQSLPSAEEYEKLKEQRQKELLREIELQRQKELEAKRLAGRMDEVRRETGRQTDGSSMLKQQV